MRFTKEEYDDAIERLIYSPVSEIVKAEYSNGQRQFWQDQKENAEKCLAIREKLYGRDDEWQEIKEEVDFWNRYAEEFDKIYKRKPGYYLKRFLNAQDSGLVDERTETYETALKEIKAGHKRTHWIWYVFPQMKGLGHSPLSEFYGILGRGEAIAYINHPILRARLVEATEAVRNNDKSAYEIFGRDTIKFRSCMALFASVVEELKLDIPIFKIILNIYKWN